MIVILTAKIIIVISTCWASRLMMDENHDEDNHAQENDDHNCNLHLHSLPHLFSACSLVWPADDEEETVRSVGTWLSWSLWSLWTFILSLILSFSHRWACVRFVRGGSALRRGHLDKVFLWSEAPSFQINAMKIHVYMVYRRPSVLIFTIVFQMSMIAENSMYLLF